MRQPSGEVLDRLRALLGAPDCTLLNSSRGNPLGFRHRTFLSQFGPRLPKEGTIWVIPNGAQSTVKYQVHVTPLVTTWLIIGAVLTSWMILPPILVILALVAHPKQYMESVLNAV